MTGLRRSKRQRKEAGLKFGDAVRGPPRQAPNRARCARFPPPLPPALATESDGGGGGGAEGSASGKRRSPGPLPFSPHQTLKPEVRDACSRA